MELALVSHVGAPNGDLANAIKDIVYSSSICGKFITRENCHIDCYLGMWCVWPFYTEYDLCRVWPNLRGRYGSKLGAGALQCINRAVERFRKRQMSLTDGMELLCQMRGFTCHMFLLLSLCARDAEDFDVSPYSSAMSNKSFGRILI